MNDNRFQIINDDEEAQRIALESLQVGIWTAIPGIVQSVDFSNMTCEVQPALQTIVVNQNGVASAVNMPLLLDVPILFPRGGNFMLTAPLAAGDEVLVVFSSRCIDAWWQNGDIQQAMEARMHDLSDGFAIPGPFSVPEIPEGAVSTTRLELRNKARDVYFGVGSKFSMVNEDTDLKALLTDLTNAVKSFMSTMAALTPPGDPVVNATLQVPGATAVSALNAVLTQIDDLLET